MSEPDLGPPADASQYGAWRAQQYRAHLEQSAANHAAAALEAHRAVSGQLRASQQGLFPGMSPTDLGAAVAGQQATVGADFSGAGGGRPVEQLGGLINWAAVSDSPAPPLVDLRPRRPGMRPTGASPLYQHMHGPKQPQKEDHHGN